MPKHNVMIASYQAAAKQLEQHLPVYPLSVVVRLGGSMPYAMYDVHINTSQAIKNSVDKLVQKKLLLKAGLQTLPLLDDVVYPCVVKGRVRSCGTKVFVVKNYADYEKAMNKIGDNYYTEPLFVATSEYRFHCTRDEVFFEVKKVKRNPADIIINHDNHYNKRDFLKPRLLKEMRAECLKAMAALDLDIACFDVMYSSKNNDKHEFVIAEANTNPELLNNTFNAYVEALKVLIPKKIEEYKNGAKLPPEPEIKQAKKPVIKVALLTENQKMQIIRDLLNDNYLVDADGGFINFKL